MTILVDTTCRTGIQIGTIDALLAQLCIHHDLTLLTRDKDFVPVAERSTLRLWPSMPERRRT